MPVIYDGEFEAVYKKAKWYAEYYAITIEAALEIIKICLERRKQHATPEQSE